MLSRLICWRLLESKPVTTPLKSIFRQRLSHYVLISLFFFTGLEIAFAVQRLIYIVLLSLIAIVIAGVFVIRYEEYGKFSPYQAILPSLAVMGLAFFALFLPVVWWLHAYLIGAAICTYYVLKHGAKQAYPTWNTAVSLITLFVVLATVIGGRFHFYIPIPALLIACFIVATLVGVQFLLRYTPDISEAWLLSIIIALVITQVIWVMQFLPLHYLVQSGIALTVYYATSQLTARHYERSLTHREIIEYLIFGGIAAFALLLTARWQ